MRNKKGISRRDLIEAIVENGGNITRASRSLHYSHHNGIRPMLRRQGIKRTMRGDVLIVEVRHGA